MLRVALALLLVTTCACAADQPGMGAGYGRLCEVRVPLDGSAVATPPLRPSAGREYLLVLRGTFSFAHDGRTYDALYAVTPSTRGGADPHSYVHIEPRLAPVEEDPTGHRYVFAVPRDVLAAGRSIAVGIDTSRFVDAYLITPSEVRAGLSGGLTMELWEHRPPPPLALAVVGWALCIGLALAALLAGVAVVRARDPLRTMLRRIEAAHASAAREAGRDCALFADVLLQLDGLRESARGIAKEGRDTLRARRKVPVGRLRAEVAELERKLAAGPPDGVRQEYETILADKRSALASLDAMRERHERAVVRLRKIEGVLGAAVVKIREARLLFDPEHREDDVIASFRGELRMVRQAIDDVRG